jgi:hypothetical protein
MDRSIFKRGIAIAGSIISAVFTVVPEEFFKLGFFLCSWSDASVVFANRLIFCVVVLILACIGCLFYLRFRKAITISDKSFSIKIEYKDLFSITNGKKVINFDECFTTSVGDRPIDIKPNSVCGQYLAKYPIEDIQSLIQSAGLQQIGIAQCNNKPKYATGMIIPRGDFLLMSFAKLDKNGLGKMTYAQYVECLEQLWQQLDLYHGTDDVFIPILGSQITRFDKELTQQELLDIMIASYRLSPKKLKRPYTLHIVCKKRDGFSLNDIFGVD